MSDEKTEEAFADYLRWAGRATELAAAEDWPALKRAIEDLTPDQQWIALHILIQERAASSKRLASASAAPLN